MVNRARSFIFSTAPLPVLAAALGAGLDLVAARAGAARGGAPQVGAAATGACARPDVHAGGESPIVPIIAGSNEAALALQVGLDGRRLRRARDPSAVGRARHRAPARDRALSGRATTTCSASPSRRRPRLTRARAIRGLTLFLVMTPTSDDIRRWDAEHVWHPFTQMQEYLATEPLVVVRAEGNYLIDDRGRRLFDGTSALWCNLLGHRVPEIDAAITEQLGRFAHTTLLGTTHPGVAELARRLVEIAPAGLNHVFFSDNGATAVESALKIAFQYRLLTQGKDGGAAGGLSQPRQRLSRRHAGRGGGRRRRAVPRHLQADPAAVAEDAVAVLLSLSRSARRRRTVPSTAPTSSSRRSRARTGACARSFSSRACRRRRAC